MASSNIKLFDENKGNMLNDTEFNISTQRINGLQTGVASSQLQNKAMYQASLVAYAIAQLMLANGKNANDTDAVSTFVNNLLASIVQKVADKATKQDVEGGIVGKWISSELLKSNNEAIDAALAAKAAAADVTALGETVTTLTAALGSGGQNARIAWGNYNGNGKYGSANPNSLTLEFRPMFLIIGASDGSEAGVLVNPATAGLFYNGYTRSLSVTWSGKTVSWYTKTDSNPALAQLNSSYRTYYWVALGYDDE